MERAHMMEAKNKATPAEKKEPPPSKEPPRKSGQRRAESLAALFRGKIDEPREFFERVMSSKHNCEDRSDLIIPYRSVIGFYRQEENYLADLRSQHNTGACVAGARYLIGRNGRGPHAE
jgi:hypothetical protein